MKLGTRKPESKPAEGSMEDLMAALKEANADHQRRRKQDRKKKGRFGWLSSAPGYAKGTVGAVVLLLVVLVVDGIRREAGEMAAGVAQVTGQVTVLKRGVGTPTPLTDKTALANQDVVKTGPDGSATLTFPDGSGVQIEPNTEFEIRLLDFARGGVRDRSFMVRSGRIVARVSEFFGSKSQATICTPTAVAAARGTGFSVYYDPARRETFVGVVDGTVDFKTSAGENRSTVGQMVASSGYRVGAPGAMNARQQERIRAGFDAMARSDKPPSFLQRVEYGLNAFLDPALQLIGLSPGSWSYAAGYAARRSATMEALKRLQQHLVSLQDEQLPDYVSLTTMEELGVDERARARIMDTFSGAMLQSYRKTGVGAYDLRVRSRDKKRTLYSLTPSGITEIKEP